MQYLRFIFESDIVLVWLFHLLNKMPGWSEFFLVHYVAACIIKKPALRDILISIKNSYIVPRNVHKATILKTCKLQVLYMDFDLRNL